MHNADFQAQNYFYLGKSLKKRFVFLLNDNVFSHILFIRITARPTEPAVINYFIRMGNLFSPNGDNEEGKEEKLIAICSQLHLTKEQLNRLQKPNGTKTARAIVRTCYSASSSICNPDNSRFTSCQSCTIYNRRILNKK